MTEERFATLAIWLASLAVPFLLFVAGNRFRSTARSCAQALVAVLAGWTLSVAYAIAAQAIVASDASQAELLAVYDRDGASRAFAVLFGWVPAIVIVGATCVAQLVVARRRPGKVGL